MDISDLSEPARSNLASIRQLWSKSRKTEAFGDLAVEEELDSYIQVSLGDLGLMLTSLQRGDQQDYDWHPQIEIAGLAAALLASLVKIKQSAAR